MAAKMREGFHTATPFLILKDCAGAIEFYKTAFGATELMRMTDPTGRVWHAEIMIGTSPIMIDDNANVSTPDPDKLPPVSIHLYVEDADAMFKQAIAAGAKVKRPMADQFYGDRLGGIEDPFGHTWWVSTHKEDLSPAEIEKRAAASH